MDFSSIFRRLIAVFAALTLLFSGVISVGDFVKGDVPTGSTEDRIEYRAASDMKAKNIILFIGDGMGDNHIEKTKLERGVSLTLDTFPVRGHSRTDNYYGTTTDSAAGGTALATGIRTANGVIASFPSDITASFTYPMSLSEYAITQRMKTGVVTTDATDGATPATFSAHASDRGNSDEISSEQIASDIDLIWGAESGAVTRSAVEDAGRVYVSDFASLDALTADEKSFGQFSGDTWSCFADASTVTLTDMTARAIELLDNDAGFFLMVEGAHIDKKSHSNESENMTDALMEFDAAIKIALDFAAADGNTVVAVTADHETGAIKFAEGGFEFTSGSHSDVDVPLFVYGNYSILQNGETVKNKEVAQRLSALISGDENALPRAVIK